MSSSRIKYNSMSSSRRNTQKHQYTTNCSVTARNLSKNELASVIFGCKNSTIKECKTNNLFGLPAQHFAYVKKVTPGMILFLFNYTDRTLHGIYEAISPGQMNIDPRGWTENATDCTSYPAQVRVRALNLCRPLAEQEFAPILADNYYKPKLFWFELGQTQTNKLIELFQAKPALPIHKTTDHGVKVKVPVSKDTSNKPESSCSNESVVTIPQTSWTSLFKDSGASDRKPNEPALEPKPSKLVLLTDDRFELEMEGSDPPLSVHAEDREFVVDDAIDINNYPRTCEAAGSSVIYQLTQEIVRLKISELEKDVKISTLEQQLAQTKLDALKRRKQDQMFGSGQTFSGVGHENNVSFPE